MRKFSAVLASVALIGTVALTGPAATAAESITGAGSSFAGGILTTCAASYTKNTVTYTPNASGTGRSGFAAGTLDFAGTDAPYAEADKKPAAFTYVPVVGGPVAILFNLPGIANLKLTPVVIGNIFAGKTTKWNDKAIAALNKGVALPDDSINVVYRSTKSGTTENFANYLVANKARGWVSSGTWGTATAQTSPVGTGAPSSSELVAKVKSTGYSIGYADLSDANKKGLPFASVRNVAGEYVKPSALSGGKFLAAQKVGADGLMNLNFAASIKGAYNLTIVTYLLAPTAAANTAKAAAVKDFASYVLKTCAPAKAAGLGYVALTGAAKTAAQKLVAKIK